MKHATPNHPKMHALAARLSLPLYAAVGLLEMLWHYVGDYAPRGDIGRVDDAAIARGVDWRKKPEELIRALVETRWLDPSQEHRFLIHDWPDHCEEYVRKKLRRAGDDFVSAYGQSLYTDRILSRQGLDTDGLTRAGKARHGSISGKRGPGENPTLNGFDGSDLAARVYDLHPKKQGRIRFEQALAEKLGTAVDPVALAERIRRSHAAWLPVWERDGGKFAPQLVRWIETDGFLDADPPSAAGLGPVPARAGSSIEDEQIPAGVALPAFGDAA